MTLSIQSRIQNIDFNKWINYFFIALAFAIPISKALDSLFAALIIIFWLIEGGFSNKFQIIKRDKLSLTVLFLIFFSILSLLWSPDIEYAIKFITIKYWNYLIIPIMLTSFKPKYIKYVLNAFLLSMLISEIVSYGIYFEVWTYNNVQPTDPSPFMNHTDYSTFLSFALILILNKIMTIQNFTWRVLYSLYFITGLTNLFINGGRTGQVTFLVTIIFMAIFYFKFSFKYIIGIILSLITILIIAYNFSPNFNDRINQLQAEVSKLYTNNDYRGSLTTRIALWRIGSEVYLDNPLLGTGIGGEVENLVKYSHKLGLKHLGMKASDYHNAFIQYAVQLGIIGLLIPLTIFYILFTLVFKNNEYKMLSIAFSIIAFLHSMGGFSFHILDSLMFIVLFSSLFNSISNNKILNSQ